MRYEKVHGFDGLDTAQMRTLQEELRSRIVTRRLEREPRIASGVDLAYDGNSAIAVMVTLDIESLEILEEVHAVAGVTLPYIPGYLAFRELPPFLQAWERAEVVPDIVFFDAQGQMHPRRMGMATHASLFIGKPTVGVAKSRLLGSYEEPGMEAGASSPVYDGGKVVGVALRTRASVSPVFVSAGNYITLQEAIGQTMRFATGRSRIPLITDLADKRTKALKRALQAARSAS